MSNEGYGGVDPALAEWLELFDDILAQQDVPLHERPLRAAVLLVRHAVVQVSDNGVRETLRERVGVGDLIQERWFGRLVRLTEAWYSGVVGPAVLRPPESTASGVAGHRGAIRLIEIPLVVTQPAECAYQQWVAFPDHVEDGEDVLAWIRPALDRTRIRPEELAALAVKVRQVARSIRYVASRARNASKGSEELTGLLAGGVRNLQSFAHFAVVGDRPERQKAWWELQMANESFLKALCLQNGKQGGYRRTHSLPELLRDAEQHGLSFDGARFADWPSEKDISDLRYATGRSVSSAELLSAYQLTLDLCEAAASSLDVQIDTGRARFLIQPLPWRIRELENGQA